MAEAPLTGVAWAAAPEAVPAGWTAVRTGGGAGGNGTGSGRGLTPLPVPADHRYRGGRGGQPGQRLRAPERRVPVREHRRSAGGTPGRGVGGEGGGPFPLRSRVPVPSPSSRPVPLPNSPPVQAPPAPVVTDVQVLSDRSPQPVGYTRAPEFPESRKYRHPERGRRGEGGHSTPVAVGLPVTPSRSCPGSFFPLRPRRNRRFPEKTAVREAGAGGRRRDGRVRPPAERQEQSHPPLHENRVRGGPSRPPPIPLRRKTIISFLEFVFSGKWVILPSGVKKGRF